MAISKRLAALLAASAFGNGIPGMDEEVEDGSGEDATEATLMEDTDSADGTSVEQDEMAAAQAAAESRSGSSTPMQVTPLRDRLTPTAEPTKGQKIRAAISDLIAGGLMGASVPNRAAGSGGDVLSAAAAGFGGAAANRDQRQARTERAEDRDFGRQSALYQTDVQMAQKQAMEDRLTAESKAKSGYFEQRGKNYEAMAKKTINMLNAGLIQVGNRILRKMPDGSIADITKTDQGDLIRKFKQEMDLIKVYNPTITDKELGRAAIQKVIPGYKTEEERSVKTPAQVKSESEQAHKKIAGTLLLSNPTYDAAIAAAKRAGSADPEFPAVDVISILTGLKAGEEKAKPKPVKTGGGSASSGIALDKRRSEVAAKQMADSLMEKYGDDAYSKAANEPMPQGVSRVDVQVQLKKAGKPAGKKSLIDWNVKPKPADGGQGQKKVIKWSDFGGVDKTKVY